MFRWREQFLIAALAGAAGCGGKAVIDTESDAQGGGGSSGGSETLRCEARFDSAQSDADFNDVFATLGNAMGGGCSADACHGGASGAAGGFFFSPTDPSLTYVNMVTFYDDDGAPLVDEDRPLDSWIHCLVRPDGGPPHGIGAEAHLLLEDWLYNGALRP